MADDDHGMAVPDAPLLATPPAAAPRPVPMAHARLVLGAWQALLDHRLALEAHRHDAESALVQLAARLVAAERGVVADGSP